MMDNNLFELLVCPICNGQLNYVKDNSELICSFDKLAFPIIDDIPVMLKEEARKVSFNE